MPRGPGIEEQLTIRLAIFLKDRSFTAMHGKVSVNINSEEGQTIGVDKYLCLGYFDF